MRLHANAKLTPEGRALLVRRVRQEGWRVLDACQAAGVSVRTGYRWLARYRAEGPPGLVDRSSVAHRRPHASAPERVRAILALRGLRMTGLEIAQALGMALSTVSGILRRAGLGRLALTEPTGPVTRYERRHPGELIHIDIKKLARIARMGHRIHADRSARNRGAGWEYVHVAIDDATRLAYVEVLADERATSIVGFLERALSWFGTRGVHARRVMTDNGSGYVSHLHADACRRLGVRHLRTRPYRPQTNGKGERFIQTLTRGWAYGQIYRSSTERRDALGRWLDWYNHSRPHAGIDRQTPAARLTQLQLTNAAGIHN
jgi:transposase InsO family protein